MAALQTQEDVKQRTRGPSAEAEGEPAVKKRKLGVSVSFADVLEGMEKAGVDTVTEEGWPRPMLPKTPTNTNSIVFQQLDIQEAVDASGLSIIRMFGVTKAGHSVLANVTDFFPYFYFLAPDGFTTHDLRPLSDHLNRMIQGKPVRNIEITRKNLMGSNKSASFLKITVTDSASLLKVKDEGNCTYRDLFTEPGRTYEVNIDHVLRFMIDLKVGAMDWIEIPAGKYQLLSSRLKLSNCQLEFNVRYNDFISRVPKGDWAPMRILSFDIECKIRGNAFPDASKDAVIQIANMVTRRGEQKPFIRNVFTLDSCSPIPGLQVLSYSDESNLLQGWFNFIKQVDPDVIIGYNIARFDLPYLFNRAKSLKMRQYPSLGRMIDAQLSVKNIPQRVRDWKDAPTLEGRLQLDIQHFIMKNHLGLPKDGGYKLNSVSAQFLGEKKEDVDFSVITELQNGNSDTRRRLAIYCAKDAYLPQRLMDKLMCLDESVKTAREAGVPFNALMSREQLVKDSRCFRAANKEGRLIADPL